MIADPKKVCIPFFSTLTQKTDEKETVSRILCGERQAHANVEMEEDVYIEESIKWNHYALNHR